MRHCIGLTLLEVMISLLLLSIILCGMDGLAISSLRQTRHSYLLQVALNEGQSMRDYLLACTAQTDIESAQQRWQQQIAALLPGGKEFIVGHYPYFSIMLAWDDEGKKQCQLQLSAALRGAGLPVLHC